MFRFAFGFHRMVCMLILMVISLTFRSVLDLFCVSLLWSSGSARITVEVCLQVACVSSPLLMSLTALHFDPSSDCFSIWCLNGFVAIRSLSTIQRSDRVLVSHLLHQRYLLVTPLSSLTLPSPEKKKNDGFCSPVEA